MDRLTTVDIMPISLFSHTLHAFPEFISCNSSFECTMCIRCIRCIRPSRTTFQPVIPCTINMSLCRSKIQSSQSHIPTRFHAPIVPPFPLCKKLQLIQGHACD